MKRAIRAFAVVGIFSVLLSSCMRQEDFDRNMFATDSFQYDIAMPLTDTRLTMENLMDLKGGLFVPDDTGLLHIIYSISPSPYTFYDEIKLSGSVNFSYQSPRTPYLRDADTLIGMSRRDSVAMDFSIPENLTVDILHIKSMSLNFELTNTFISPADFTLTFENILDASGNAVVVNRTVQAGKSEMVEVSLDDADLVRRGERLYLNWEMETGVKITKDLTDSTVYSGSFGMWADMVHFELQKLEGNIGRQAFDFRGKMEIAGLAAERMENIDFQEAAITTDLRVEGISAPIRIKESWASLSHRGGERPFDILPSPYNVPYPAADAWPLVKDSTVSVDALDILVDCPREITFEVEGELNPDDDREAVHMAGTSAEMGFRLNCDIPLHFSADRYALIDTLPIGFDNIPSEISFSYFDLKTILVNAFPFDFSVTIVFLDRDYNPVFTLFENRMAQSAEVGPAPELHVSQPTTMTYVDELGGSQVEAVRGAAYIALTANINTYRKEEVKVYMSSETESFFNVKVGFRAKIGMPLNIREIL